MKGQVRQRGAAWEWLFTVPGEGTTASGAPKRRTISKGGYRLKREAQAGLAEAMSVYAGAPVKPSSMVLAAYVTDEWLPALERDLKPSTVRGYQDQMRAYILPALGRVKLRDLAPSHVVRLYTDLRANGRRQGTGGLSEASVHKVHVTLGRCLRDATEAGLLATNPMLRVPRAARPRQAAMAASHEGMQVWSAEEVGRFLESVADDRLGPAYRLVLSVGLRRGEVCGLRWDDVDLDGGRLVVRRARTVVGTAVVEGTPKGRRARTISLGSELVGVLRAHRRRQLEERMAWGEAWADTGYVFVREDGTPLHPQTLAGHFERAARAAGLPPIRFHDLRHTALTHLLANGVPPKVVAEVAGHASTRITEDIYSHVLPNMSADAAAVADRMYSS